MIACEKSDIWLDERIKVAVPVSVVWMLSWLTFSLAVVEKKNDMKAHFSASLLLLSTLPSPALPFLLPPPPSPLLSPLLSTLVNAPSSATLSTTPPPPPSTYTPASLLAKTRGSLQYYEVLRTVAGFALTTPGRDLILSTIDAGVDSDDDYDDSTPTQAKVAKVAKVAKAPPTLAEVSLRYSQLTEMTAHLALPPSSPSMFPSSSSDLAIFPILLAAQKTKETLDYDAFKQILAALEYLDHIAQYFTAPNRETYPTLSAIAQNIFVPPKLLLLLSESFDSNGSLSRTRYPEIGRLESAISSKQKSITSLLATISDSIPGSYVNPINSRYTLAVNPTLTKSLGVLHSRSRTDKTSYVEPFAVIEPTNALTQLEEDLDRAVQKIFRTLTDAVLSSSSSLTSSLAAAASLDALRARHSFGSHLRCTIPSVQEESIIEVRLGRHPLIKDAVANSVEIGEEKQCLILSVRRGEVFLFLEVLFLGRHLSGHLRVLFLSLH